MSIKDCKMIFVTFGEYANTTKSIFVLIMQRHDTDIASFEHLNTTKWIYENLQCSNTVEVN